MRLPLLCVALISVLTGCNGTCTSDRCTISSLTSEPTVATHYQTTTAFTPTFPPPTASITPYQPPTDSASPTGFIAPSVIRGGCTNTGAAEYSSKSNAIHVCQDLPADYYRFAIAHETGHAKDFQSKGEYSPDLEFVADKYAVDTLLQKGDCEAIGAKARQAGWKQDEYEKGSQYAREQYAAHC